jgi:hypothetical protein
VKALVVVVVLLLGLAVAADRIAVSVAEDRVASQIESAGQLAGPPTVDIAGFPFLTQALGGDYRDVGIQLDPEDLDRGGTSADVRLHGVHVPLSDVLSGSVQQVPVDRVDGTATVAYSVVAAQIGGDTELAEDGGRLRVTRTVEVFGRSLKLTALGSLTLDGNDLVYSVEEASGAGLEVPQAVIDRAGDLLDFRFTVPALPFGLRLTGVTPTPGGVVVDVSAQDTVLTG